MSKFLLLIDDVNLVNQISNILAQRNFEVISEPNLENGFARILEVRPDLVVMNIMNDQSKNWKLHYQIRTSTDLEKLPVLVITSRNHKYDKIPGLISTRLDDYITHPFVPDELVFRVQNLISRAEAIKPS